MDDTVWEREPLERIAREGQFKWHIPAYFILALHGYSARRNTFLRKCGNRALPLGKFGRTKK
jgi:hypothetical protein